MKIIVLLLFFIFLCNLNTSYGGMIYKYVDLSPQGTNDVYVTFAVGGIRDCHLRYNLVMDKIAPDTNLTCNTCKTFIYSITDRNDTHILVNMDIIHPYPITSFLVQIVDKVASNSDTITLNCVCQEASLVDIKYYNSESLYYSYNLANSFPVFGFNGNFSKVKGPSIEGSIKSTASGFSYPVTIKSISPLEYVGYVQFLYASEDWSFLKSTFTISLTITNTISQLNQNSGIGTFYEEEEFLINIDTMGSPNIVQNNLNSFINLKPGVKGNLFFGSTNWETKLVNPFALVEFNETVSNYYCSTDISESNDYTTFFIQNGVANYNTVPFTYLTNTITRSTTSAISLIDTVRLIFRTTNTNQFDILNFIPNSTYVQVSFYQPYPFGYTYGNSSSYFNSRAYPITSSFSKQFIFYIGVDYLLYDPKSMEIGMDTEPPVIESVLVSHVPYSNLLLYTITINDDISGFKHLEKFGDYTNIVLGTKFNNTYQFVMDPYNYVRLYQGFNLCDFNSNCRNLNIFEPINVLGIKIPFKYLKLSDITSISFMKNDINVTNASVDNILLIRSSVIDNYLPMVMVFKDETKPNVTIDPVINVGYYNETLQAYAIPFTVVQHYVFGDYPYYLYIENRLLSFSDLRLKFGRDATLRVNSNLVDILGPVVVDVSIGVNNKYTIAPITGIAHQLQKDYGKRTLKSILPVNVIYPINGEESFFVKIIIKDTYNGLKKGFLSVFTSTDLVQYNFTFDTSNLYSGDKYLGTYKFDFQATDRKCKSQQYQIGFLQLEDELGHKTVYNYTGINRNIINPIDRFNYPFASIICSDMEDYTPPTLTQFTYSPNTIDTTNYGTRLDISSRIIEFQFETFDANGLNIDANPVVYLQDSSFGVISQRARPISTTSNTTQYNCTFILPYGFGWPNGIRASVYGIVDTQGNFNGYSVSDMPFENSIRVTARSGKAAIFSASSLTVNGGFLTIYGSNFFNSTTIDLEYSNFAIVQSFKPIYFNTRMIIINNIPSLQEGYYYLTAKTIGIQVSKEGSTSNSLKIIVGKDTAIYPESSSSDSETPPQECKNNCNGPEQGMCSPKGCICKYPWVGLDCSSQVIIVDPTINTTHPETNLNDKVINSIISIVGLNELDIDGVLINQYKFENWTATNINNDNPLFASITQHHYQTNITNKLDQSTITRIDVDIVYFNQSTPVNITFANQVLTMNPYSLKYSINISSYQFSNSLNTLQLVMAASIENEDGQCSAQEKGNIVESNSEFIKIQVDDHSLYGRFIKRGIIDGRISKTISNEILNDSNYFKSSSTQSKSNAFIGINIPNFKSLAQLDPDFSVLVDSRSASENENSICSKKNSKLSTAQLAGIIVGSVAFAAVIVTSLVYYLYKKKIDTRENLRVQQKLKTMNKN